MAMKHVGTGYATVHLDQRNDSPEMVTSNVHTSVACARLGEEMVKVSLYYRGDQLISHHRGRDIEVEYCTFCPDHLEWDWQEQGKCYGQGVDMFPMTYVGRQDVIEQFCNQCPVVSECLDFAVSMRATAGIWGGENFFNRERRVEVSKQRTRLMRGLAGVS